MKPQCLFCGMDTAEYFHARIMVRRTQKLIAVHGLTHVYIKKFYVNIRGKICYIYTLGGESYGFNNFFFTEVILNGFTDLYVNARSFYIKKNRPKYIERSKFEIYIYTYL